MPIVASSYHVLVRRTGLPGGVDADKIETKFSDGVHIGTEQQVTLT